MYTDTPNNKMDTMNANAPAPVGKGSFTDAVRTPKMTTVGPGTDPVWRLATHTCRHRACGVAHARPHTRLHRKISPTQRQTLQHAQGDQDDGAATPLEGKTNNERRQTHITMVTQEGVLVPCRPDG
jgi:hypothetical protein